MQFTVVKVLRGAVVAAGIALACASTQAQTPAAAPANIQDPPPVATGAPLRLLAPLPNEVSAPTPRPGSAETGKPAAAAKAADAPAVPVAVPAAPAVAGAFALPPADVPEPVTSEMFATGIPSASSPPAPVVSAAVPAAPPAAAPPATVAPPATPPAVPPPSPKAGVAEKPEKTATEPRKLTVIVAGDSIADGIWGGLYRKLLRDKRYEIVRKARNSSGFVAFDWVEELAEIEEIKRADAVVFLAGTNDRQSLVRKGKPRYLFGTREWEEGYVERVVALMEALKARNIPLVWVSLPIARKDEFNKDSRYLNGLFARAAAQADVYYIDIWPMFADKDGQYSAYLPDADGRNRLMRDNDGIHFTPRGYEMIADVVLEKLQKTVPAFEQAASAAEPNAASAGARKAN